MYSINSGRPPLARRSENCGIDIIIESGARLCAPTVEQVVGWVDAPKPNKIEGSHPCGKGGFCCSVSGE
ncbi:MAG: hypothetical protein RIE73_20445 [Coleofasciculus sp. C1-SOL-03]|uniref:hypothetical protein n=1 Tax=Coleofasciculus sp. C1-SOL-03 TaxID=3069522 RepID=UPI0033035318